MIIPAVMPSQALGPNGTSVQGESPEAMQQERQSVAVVAPVGPMAGLALPQPSRATVVVAPPGAQSADTPSTAQVVVMATAEAAQDTPLPAAQVVVMAAAEAALDTPLPAAQVVVMAPPEAEHGVPQAPQVVVMTAPSAPLPVPPKSPGKAAGPVVPLRSPNMVAAPQPHVVMPPASANTSPLATPGSGRSTTAPTPPVSPPPAPTLLPPPVAFAPKSPVALPAVSGVRAPSAPPSPVLAPPKPLLAPPPPKVRCYSSRCPGPRCLWATPGSPDLLLRRTADCAAGAENRPTPGRDARIPCHPGRAAGTFNCYTRGNGASRSPARPCGHFPRHPALGRAEASPKHAGRQRQRGEVTGTGQRRKRQAEHAGRGRHADVAAEARSGGRDQPGQHRGYLQQEPKPSYPDQLQTGLPDRRA